MTSRMGRIFGIAIICSGAASPAFAQTPKIDGADDSGEPVHALPEMAGLDISLHGEALQ